MIPLVVLGVLALLSLIEIYRLRQKLKKQSSTSQEWKRLLEESTRDLRNLQQRIRTDTSPQASQIRRELARESSIVSPYGHPPNRNNDTFPIAGVHGPLTDAMRAHARQISQDTFATQSRAMAEQQRRLENQAISMNRQMTEQERRVEELEMMMRLGLVNSHGEAIPARPADPRVDIRNYVDEIVDARTERLLTTAPPITADDVKKISKMADDYKKAKAKQEKDSGRFDLIEID